MISVPPHLAAAIQRRIDALETDGIGRWVLRVCKHELNALPTLGNQIYIWALRPDGTVLCMDHEAFSHPVEEVSDPLVAYAVCHEAARRYPELRELVPPRPAGVVPCDACGATGWIEATGAACSVCDAMGWRAPPRPAS